MGLVQLFFVALAGLLANRSRSVLTVLGIVIGVVAVVLVMSLGQGARHLVLREVESVGGTTLVVVPGRAPEGPTDFAGTLLSNSLKERDLEALRRSENVPHARLVEPAILASGSVLYQSEVSRPLVLGMTPTVLTDILRITPVRGALFMDVDVRSRARVVVLGSDVKSDLFGDAEAVGEIVSVRGVPLRVVGVLPPLGQVLVFNADETVFVPVSVAQHDLLNIDYYHRVFVVALDGVDLEFVAADIRATLREQHGITDAQKDDFFVVTPHDIAEGVTTITRTLTIFLVALASISLLVSGVGIMTIMLVVVTERTHEIGLRKAVGATTTNVLWQFLLEAVLLTAGGGAAGVVLASMLSFIVAWFIRHQFGLLWQWELPMGAILFGVGMAMSVGLVFGVYPARLAATKDPIEALRSE